MFQGKFQFELFVQGLHHPMTRRTVICFLTSSWFCKCCARSARMLNGDPTGPSLTKVFLVSGLFMCFHRVPELCHYSKSCSPMMESVGDGVEWEEHFTWFSISFTSWSGCQIVLRDRKGLYPGRSILIIARKTPVDKPIWLSGPGSQVGITQGAYLLMRLLSKSLYWDHIQSCAFISSLSENKCMMSLMDVLLLGSKNYLSPASYLGMDILWCCSCWDVLPPLWGPWWRLSADQ